MLGRIRYRRRADAAANEEPLPWDRGRRVPTGADDVRDTERVMRVPPRVSDRIDRVGKRSDRIASGATMSIRSDPGCTRGAVQDRI
ncbi:hypothetical protein GCM10027167_46190 [Nocardia heshunensis]